MTPKSEPSNAPIFLPDGSVAEDAMPPKITGTGIRGAITSADIGRAGGIATSSPGRRPPTLLRATPFPWGRPGPVLDIDLFDLNPYVSIVRQLPAADGITGEPPTMFAAGDLPIITASGVDPALLAHVPWTHRNSAATTGDVGVVYTLIEEAEALDQNTLQTRAGVEAFERYRAAVWAWATKPPPVDAMTEAEFEEWTFGTTWQQSTPQVIGAKT
jgi:hypothetical protein